MSNSHAAGPATQAKPAGLLPDTPARWLAVFGPGAVIASLTIGAGELIFSARAGALFGYRLLWWFGVILIFKWALVYAAARHMVISGAHPFQRWAALPGPHGWVPLLFFILGLISFPIWVGFHAGTLGTLTAWLTKTDNFRGGHFIWGSAILAVIWIIAMTGGYRRLERAQLVMITLMLLCVVVSLLLLKPDWGEVVRGLLLIQALDYPEWALANPEFGSRPVWVEVTTYVGVIGGASYDYLAYVSWLRHKNWGQAGGGVASEPELSEMASDPAHPNRRWLRAPLIDCTLSFLAVIFFSAVFVICGALILAPNHQVPSGSDLLNLQAAFVTPLHPWLKAVYFAGAFLTILGTLYGTIEVAPAVWEETLAAVKGPASARTAACLRYGSLLWVCCGGLMVLIAGFLSTLWSKSGTPPGLVALLTPANLFTGVLGCGLVCFLNLWVDRRFLSPALRMRWPIILLNLIGGAVFIGLGIKAYWDHSRWGAFLFLAGALLLGLIAAVVMGKRGWFHSSVLKPQP